MVKSNDKDQEIVIYDKFGLAYFNLKNMDQANKYHLRFPFIILPTKYFQESFTPSPNQKYQRSVLNKNSLLRKNI